MVLWLHPGFVGILLNPFFPLPSHFSLCKTTLKHDQSLPMLNSWTGVLFMNILCHLFSKHTFAHFSQRLLFCRDVLLPSSDAEFCSENSGEVSFGWLPRWLSLCRTHWTVKQCTTTPESVFCSQIWILTSFSSNPICSYPLLDWWSDHWSAVIYLLQKKLLLKRLCYLAVIFMQLLRGTHGCW